jgi:mRNA interferase MazF
MPIFEVWDIVKVPFPYTDRPVRQRRPALVIAAVSGPAAAELVKPGGSAI